MHPTNPLRARTAVSRHDAVSRPPSAAAHSLALIPRPWGAAGQRAAVVACSIWGSLRDLWARAWGRRFAAPTPAGGDMLRPPVHPPAAVVRAYGFSPPRERAAALGGGDGRVAAVPPCPLDQAEMGGWPNSAAGEPNGAVRVPEQTSLEDLAAWRALLEPLRVQQRLALLEKAGGLLLNALPTDPSHPQRAAMRHLLQLLTEEAQTGASGADAPEPLPAPVARASEGTSSGLSTGGAALKNRAVALGMKVLERVAQEVGTAEARAFFVRVMLGTTEFFATACRVEPTSAAVIEKFVRDHCALMARSVRHHPHFGEGLGALIGACVARLQLDEAAALACLAQHCQQLRTLWGAVGGVYSAVLRGMVQGWQQEAAVASAGACPAHRLVRTAATMAWAARWRAAQPAADQGVVPASLFVIDLGVLVHHAAGDAQAAQLLERLVTAGWVGLWTPSSLSALQARLADFPLTARVCRHWRIMLMTQAPDALTQAAALAASGAHLEIFAGRSAASGALEDVCRGWQGQVRLVVVGSSAVQDWARQVQAVWRQQPTSEAAVQPQLLAGVPLTHLEVQPPGDALACNLALQQFEARGPAGIVAPALAPADSTTFCYRLSHERLPVAHKELQRAKRVHDTTRKRRPAGASDVGLAVLRVGEEPRYVVTETIFASSERNHKLQGATSKGRVAVNAAGQAFFVKEFSEAKMVETGWCPQKIAEEADIGGGVDLLKVHRPNSLKQPSYYLFLPLAAQGDLFEVLKRRGHRADFAAGLQVLGDVGADLAALHKKRRAHCDVKMENVLVGEDGRARLGDFGCVVKDGERWSLRGTLGCLAPELVDLVAAQRAVRVHAAAADVWSLGKLVLECAWGLELVERTLEPPVVGRLTYRLDWLRDYQTRRTSGESPEQALDGAAAAVAIWAKKRPEHLALLDFVCNGMLHLVPILRPSAADCVAWAQSMIQQFNLVPPFANTGVDNFALYREAALQLWQQGGIKAPQNQCKDQNSNAAR